MAKRKKITKDEIISSYMTYILENNTPPKSVFAFAKANNFEEAQFYTCFGSFEAIEKEILKTFLNNTIETLNKSEEYASFDSRNKLLSFYFTFFETLSANRSYILLLLKKNSAHLKKLATLSELKKGFTNYIDELEIETVDFKEKKITQIQKKGIKETAWMQLLITINFWMNDTSPSFEKTDIFIEKSVNTSFDLLDTTPLKSMIDLGKFLYKEKMNVN
ncbi:TetR family transcriptional regulator C-terminal domain-containing protein [Lutibacter flavus]|uniref:Tetracyclin repressor-like C-terminal domain-containing protein n=1 Tax=Lutibacter flavus TaxID=691689 RepID=A0A238VUI3_9FLAO|nr:TetR/AcrR family transcriptional regulator [Lutibacter flavus]SNR37463.1 hypothetical protein SAMN04488111_1004 [Lutibacter flavus]